MTRVKTWPVTTRRHKKVLKQAKWYELWRSKVFVLAKTAVMKAWLHAYKDRKVKKRKFRQLWIIRLSSFLRERWIRYSDFINKISNSDFFVNRKMLSNLCISHPPVMEEIIKSLK